MARLSQGNQTLSSAVTLANGGITPVSFAISTLFNNASGSSIAPDVIGFEISWTGTPTGNIQLQGNLTGLAGTMNNLPATSSLTFGGAAGSGVLSVNLTAVKVNFIQGLITLSGGAGTITVVTSYSYWS